MFSTDPIKSCSECVLGRACAPRPCGLVSITRPAGALICAQGARSPNMHFVKAGMISLSTTGGPGAGGSLALRGPSSLLCPEAASGDVSPFEVRALTCVQLCSFSGNDLDQWIGPAGSPARVMFEFLLSNRMRQTDGQATHRTTPAA
jgi:CRP/FNR family transcriptional regulator, cyclic AMP receptor protein